MYVFSFFISRSFSVLAIHIGLACTGWVCSVCTTPVESTALSRWIFGAWKSKIFHICTAKRRSFLNYWFLCKQSAQKYQFGRWIRTISIFIHENVLFGKCSVCSRRNGTTHENAFALIRTHTHAHINLSIRNSIPIHSIAHSESNINFSMHTKWKWSNCNNIVLTFHLILPHYHLHWMH